MTPTSQGHFTRTHGRDAVVIGSGHNGLTAANLLADAGWNVVVLEAADRPGGAVRSDRSLHPDFVTDWFSSFYPLGVASSALAGLELERWGLQWLHAPAVLAHVFPDGRCAVLDRDRTVTAASLDTFAPGDGAAWLRIVRDFERIAEPFLHAALGPFPPVRAGVGLARRLGVADALRFARFALQPVRSFGAEHFNGDGGPILFAGNALHTDLSPETGGSALFGWLLAMLGQTVGFPVPAGGAGGIIDALLNRFAAVGGEVRLSSPVASVDVVDGQARGVRLASGETIWADVVVADVSAPSLYLDLVGAEHLPARMVEDLQGFEWDSPTLKLNWALSAPIPWTATDAARAGTVHIGVDLDGLTHYAADLVTKRLPEHPFALLGQMTTTDASRSPAGTESAWAYTHLPAGLEVSAGDVEQQARRVEAAIEAQAPGFGALILARSVQSPADLHDADANLVHGAVGGGTSALHQEAIFRPVVGLARTETPVRGLYLASASAHPGGGVHGAAGSNAATAIVRGNRVSGRIGRAGVQAAYRRIYR